MSRASRRYYKNALLHFCDDFLSSLSVFLQIFCVTVAFCAVFEKCEAKEPIKLEEVLRYEYSTKGWNATWISDSVLLYKKDDGNLYTIDVRTRAPNLLYNTTSGNYSKASHTLSPGGNYVLITYNPISIFRHSRTAQYAIYDIAYKKHYDVADKKQLQLVEWAPNDSGLAYVFDNNIYYISPPSNVNNPSAITSDGVPGVVYNGAPDWVYEEEVLGSGSALWFSPNGKYLAFINFNDEKVDNFTYIKYGDPKSLDNQYTEVVSIKYPKPGRANPTVLLKVANVNGDIVMQSTVRKLRRADEIIIYDVVWANDEEVAEIVTNRVQNKGYLYRCNVPQQKCYQDKLFEERRGWLSLQAPTYNKNGLEYLMVLPQIEGNDTYRHIVLVNSEGQETRLTHGRRVVQNIYGWDERNNLVYYSSTVEDYPSQQHIYVVNTKTKEDKCVSCNFETPSGVCLYAGGAFSKNYTYLAKVCQGRGPYYVTVENLHDSRDGFVWEDNGPLLKKLENKQRPIIRDVDVRLESGFIAKVRLLLPEDFSETKKYPAVVNVYAGPDSSRISDVYSMSFPEYFSTNRHYIYIFIDGRGSGKKGDNIKFEIYRRLGTVEIDDQISVTKCLQDNFPFIDASRTGIWGWSYGGFATLQALAKDTQNIFRFGLAVAPVTNFINYDTIYTERFMGLPTKEDNLDGYNRTNVMADIEALRGKNLFLVHGNADDNVHYQQSMLLARALELADIPFLQASYPDENHSIGGAYPHLYHAIDRFWARSFGLADPPRSDLPEEE